VIGLTNMITSPTTSLMMSLKSIIKFGGLKMENEESAESTEETQAESEDKKEGEE